MDTSKINHPDSGLDQAPTNSHSGTHKAYLPFHEFVPTYRGRPVERPDPKYKPLDSSRIYELSLMCRSGFGKQEGEFEVIVQSIKGWKREDNKGSKIRVRDGCWDWVKAWWDGNREGGVRLDEKD